MTLTVDSDLNGTWTRDSEIVSGGMTVLNDPVTAQYTHTLTVTGRLGGLYQCTVANNKPSTATAQLAVKGEAFMFYEQSHTIATLQMDSQTGTKRVLTLQK